MLEENCSEAIWTDLEWSSWSAGPHTPKIHDVFAAHCTGFAPARDGEFVVVQGKAAGFPAVPYWGLKLSWDCLVPHVDVNVGV